ncbi:hypothetical protein PQC39_gp055 [Vibrio phage Vp_R1]|uniref:Uncharacterized protein n=1 Tax=Vibrio phage Vp_R1 TaxID=2059867 RepID=A0A2H5BQ10_9CAUD|nr:hypothetical protein PQC39_gp055 [Vibrio phage Vp_R1]AUG88419.1 hypothetical protein VPR_055 [Vibrio phage Vp_R1]
MAALFIMYLVIALMFIVNEIKNIKEVRIVYGSDLAESMLWILWPAVIAIAGLEKASQIVKSRIVQPILEFINK